MNDNDFFTQFQETPNLEFSTSLYTKIAQPAKQSFHPAAIRRLGLTVGILITFLSMSFIFVPTVRAEVESIIRKIAGYYFEEVTQSPITCNPMTNCEYDQVLGVMSLEEAQAFVPFAVTPPTWTPDGYWQNPKVKVIHAHKGFNYVEMEWLKTGFTQENHWDYTQQMTLTIWQDQKDDPTWIVGTGSVTEIKVNSQPAALIHGGWELFNKNWNGSGMTVVTWVKDGIRYTLSVAFVEPATTTSDEDLIRMAESIP